MKTARPMTGAIRRVFAAIRARMSDLAGGVVRAGVDVGAGLLEEPPQQPRRVGVGGVGLVDIGLDHGAAADHRSVAGLVALPGQAPYCASKFAVVGLTRALQGEARGLGVDVTLVCPGVIQTPIYDTSPIRGFAKDGVLGLWPRGISAEACADQIVRARRWRDQRLGGP